MNQPQKWSWTRVFAQIASPVRAYSAKEWVRCSMLALIGFLARVPALQGQLVWDDGFLMRDNPFIRSPLFILEVFRHHLFLDSFSAHYRPVQNISMMFDYFLWNNDPFGYHLTNVLLHVGSALLLYYLTRRIFREFFVSARITTEETNAIPANLAFFVALLWVVHPVHSAAIDYISGRADSLAFLFASGAWLLFLRARGIERPVFRYALFAGAWFSALLALCSRESALIWVVLFLLYCFGFCRPVFARWKWPALCGIVLLIAAYAELRQLPGPRAVVGGSYGWPFSVRAVLMFRALGDYTRLMFFPANLHMERTVFDPAPMIDSVGRYATVGLEYLSIVGLIMLVAFALLSWHKGRGQRARIFGASWFILSYLPISNLFDLNATVAEHWLYLPSVGFIIFVVGCAVDLPVRLQRASLGVAAVAVIALAARSAMRSSDWVNDVAFYERTLAAGGSSSRVLGNLAQLYSAHGNYPKAEAMFRSALKMCPDYPMARNNLAEALARQGKKVEAEALIASTSRQTEQTRNEYPRTWIPVMNHALYREKDKDNDGALAIAEKARHDYPGVWEIIRFEANLLHDMRGAAAGVPLLEEFTRDHWWHHDAAVALGRFYAETGEEKKAETILRHASWLDVYDAEALSALAEMRVHDNRLNEACAIQKRAVARQPDQPRQYILLSSILDKMGRNAESKAALAEVSRLRLLAGIPDGAAKLTN